jgi:hypothetical protein
MGGDGVAPQGDRTKHVFGDVLPVNAQAALLFARLAQVTGDPSYRRRARTTSELRRRDVGSRRALDDLPGGCSRNPATTVTNPMAGGSLSW